MSQWATFFKMCQKLLGVMFRAHLKEHDKTNGLMQCIIIGIEELII